MLLLRVACRRTLPRASFNNSLRRLSTKENIYTIPNALTVSRIASCPVLAWAVLEGNYHLATGLLIYAGVTDLVCLSVNHLRMLPTHTGRWLPRTEIQHVLCSRHSSRPSSRQNPHDNTDSHSHNAKPDPRYVQPYPITQLKLLNCSSSPSCSHHLGQGRAPHPLRILDSLLHITLSSKLLECKP